MASQSLPQVLTHNHRVTVWSRLATVAGKASMCLPTTGLRRLANALYGAAYRQMGNPWYDGTRWLERD